MASYHLSVKAGGKGKAGPHAAYIARADKYARRKGHDLEFAQAGNLPAWAMHNPAEFWRAADAHERANGCTYREIELALPRELTPAQRLALVRDFVDQELGDRHVYQFAIHNPAAAIAGGEQPHAHIMFSERVNDGIARDPVHYFRRANGKHPARGGAKKARFGETPTERRVHLSAQRQRWADLQNRYLAWYDHAARVDARSHRVQGIDRPAERHLGAFGVRKLDAVQLQAVIDRRAAERQAALDTAARDAVIDVTTSLRDALATRALSPGVSAGTGPGHAPEQEDTAAPDSPAPAALQALIDASMAEFQGMYDRIAKQQKMDDQALYSAWRQGNRAAPDDDEPDPDPPRPTRPRKGSSFSP